MVSQNQAPKSWVDGSPVTKFRLSDNKQWATEFEANNYEEFASKFMEALKFSTGRLVSLHSFQSGWFNVGNVLMGVFYDGEGKLNSSPGRYEVRGNGFKFLSVSPEQPMIQEVWNQICGQRHADNVPTIDCRLANTPEKQNLNDIYNDLVSRARNYRRQMIFASPKQPINRAAEKEAHFDNELTELAQKYREAALKFRPNTNWSEWEQYVRRTLHPEIADIVCQFVIPQI